jgi:hypothetical protein
VKQAKNLAPVHDLLAKCRHLTYAELRDPGSYYRLLAKAEQIIRTGHNPDAGSFEDMQALIRRSTRTTWTALTDRPHPLPGGVALARPKISREFLAGEALAEEA